MAWSKSRNSSGGSSFTVWIVLAAVVVLIDQVSKIAILRVFKPGQRMPVIDNWFDLTLAFNKGAAFSFLAGASGWQREFFIGIGSAATLFILWMLWRHGHQKMFSLALTLIMGGAIGNVIDRVLMGHVVDFLLVYHGDWYWPAFNVADSAIVGGAGLLILDELLRVRRG
jgi:signal peptidase II